jgi:hypothetical protein
MEANKDTLLVTFAVLLGLHVVYSHSFVGATLGFLVGVFSSSRVKAWAFKARIQYLVQKQRWSGAGTQKAMPPPPQ